MLFGAIERKSVDLGCEVLAINGVSDHVHVAVRIPPTLAVTEWAKHVKGVSSRELNVALGTEAERFRWQDGFGVLTFGAKNLDLVLNYIHQQKQHHQQQTLEPYLERIE